MKKNKCKFVIMLSILAILLIVKGCMLLQAKFVAIVKAPKPQNVTELRAYLSLVNYYGKFIPNLASTLQPLNSLLRKNCKWVWSEEYSTRGQ